MRSMAVKEADEARLQLKAASSDKASHPARHKGMPPALAQVNKHLSLLFLLKLRILPFMVARTGNSNMWGVEAGEPGVQG